MEMVLFSASWCSNCQPVKAIIEGKGIECSVVDIDVDHEAAVNAGVRGIPSLLVDGVLHRGQEAVVAFLKTLP